MKIVYYGQLARPQICAMLEQYPEVQTHLIDLPEGLDAHTDGAEALFISGQMYTEQVAAWVKRAPKLRWLQVLTAGYEAVERYGLPSSVEMTNAGNAWSVPVAEHTMALALSMVKRLDAAQQAQHAARWERGYTSKMGALQGRTMVIVGYGSIGRELAIRAKAFGMRIVGVNRSGGADAVADRIYKSTDLHRALSEADIAVLAVPATDQTRRLIDATAIAEMPRGSMLINVARGTSLDHDALVHALNSGHLSRAALDVTEPEPLPEGHSLWKVPNLIITPHIAGAAGDLVPRALAAVVRGNLSRMLEMGAGVAHKVGQN